jgi:phosphatidylglycerophosphatase A
MLPLINGVKKPLTPRILEPLNPGLMNRFVLLLATGFGSGYSHVIPGTMGTLVAIPIFLILSGISSPFYEITLLAFFFLAVWTSEKAQEYWGVKDDRRIVIDEIMGFLVTMLWVQQTFFSIILGFFLFRCFDIIKLPPIRFLERAKGGYGVVLDDVLAGVYANIVLHLVSLLGR